jgi:hypothetical protein
MSAAAKQAVVKDSLTAQRATPAAPSGMTIVGRDDFFAALATDKRDIMPNRNDNLWLVQNTREIWGWSHSDCVGRPVYALAKSGRAA